MKTEKNTAGTISLPGGRKAQQVPAKTCRVVDTLGTLLRRGRIDLVTYEAGRTFAEDFEQASFGGIKGTDYSRTGGSGSSWNSPTECAILNGQRVSLALDALGGVSGPCGKAAWNVLGLGLSLSQWAANDGFDNMEARGILLSALHLLAKHYRYV